ncbi:alpha/beta fold hydrolase [Parasulfitobacter algicola]|uniref:Alpha/beta fold hydrolase n=1 Tax=Parasulfitobacter algicola TaxID=2614809 RepID=A0ABX2IQK0_9RHOB|nr:alpha/beta fold hydrolase [Sulfitobacter algicola]NSX54635.1 alpha/beta fold hydrolase [Sulfitobacter algicola]
MTPLVLLPGMMCDARLFMPQIAVLGKRRAIHVAPITDYDTVQALAADVLQNAPPRFALAGLSMGGIVAMQIFTQAPDRVAGLALMDTNALAEAPDVKARRKPQIEKVRKGHLRTIMRDEMKPNYLADGPDRDQILDLCMDMAMDLGADVFVRQSIALRDRPDQQHTLQKIHVPTLVLCGKNDTLCPVERHQLIHSLIPKSNLQIIQNAGHLPTLEQPEQTTAALLRWLEDI